MESVSKTSDVNLKGKWQWKSNSDPWSKTEEPQWTSYSSEHNYLIEKAYFDKKPEVDLGEHTVSIKHMIQKKEGMVVSQRPIRRKTGEDDEMDVRSERYFETELPKTINKIFGSLEHFITFFSRRNPEILSFTKQFEEFEKQNDLEGFNKNILPQLICCLDEELLRTIEDQLSDPSISEDKKRILRRTQKRHEELVSLFKIDSGSFEEFYGLTLRSYTMNTDLYLNLNKYLRNENWTALDNLSPYAICLCKAFFSLKLSKINQKDNKLPVTENSIILYRGTALDESALDHYQEKKASKLFSWYSVTSTSRKREIAENFMYESADVEKKKYPVLFIIEIPLGNEARESEYLKWIEIQQYSAIPSEDEVILAPGNAFEVEQVSTDQSKTTIIKMKLKHEVESLAHGGMIMQGAFQNEMMSDKQVSIMCLEGEELYEALKNISGNRLIEEIGFILCIFDQRSLEEMLFILPTLEKAKRLKLVSCKYEDKQEVSSGRLQSLKDCKIEEIEISEVQDIFERLSLNKQKRFERLSLNKQDHNFWGSLKTLNIDFGKIMSDDWIPQTFKFPTGLTSLNLNFTSCQLKDKVVKNLTSQGLNYFTQLTSLTLNFSFCAEIRNEGVASLASQGLRKLAQLNSLTLSFLGCQQITDQEISSLASKEFSNLTQLTSLTLNFSSCCYITDEGVSNLAFQGLKDLTKLTSLTLNFSDCREITNQGMTILASQELKCLTQLTALTLDFSNCPEITNEGVTILASQRLKSLTQLTSLDLNFCSCPEITNEGVRNLASQGLKYLTQLSSLTLDFSYCSEITNEGVSNLATQGLKDLTRLTSLTLNFWDSPEIIEEVDNFEFQVLKELKDLTQLTLFILNGRVMRQTCQHHQAREDQGLTNKSLRLDFTRPMSQNQLRSLVDDPPGSTRLFENNKLNEEIEGVLNKFILKLIHCQDIKMSSTSPIGTLSSRTRVSIERNLDENTMNLPITSLEVFFWIYFDSSPSETNHLPENEQIKNEGVSNLASQGLKYFIQSTSLTLDLSDSPEIIDEGVSNFAFQGLKYLTQLTFLTLNFSRCSQITDVGVIKLASQGLKSLTQLTSLTLDFSSCTQITDEGVSNLAFQGLKYLTQLTSLTLNFSRCSHITDVGVIKLASQGLKSLTQLTSLTLNFSDCPEITGEGVCDLAYQGLKYLTQLTSLTLNFSRCPKIADDGVSNLAFHALKYLTKLTSLALDFSFCREITNQGVIVLAYNVFECLTQLTSLTLSFSFCTQLTNEGVTILASQGLKHLTQLNSLNLNFSNCFEITDEGVSNLAFEALTYLTQLTSLTLDFSVCLHITDEGLNKLIYQMIRHSTQLTTLTLDFSSCGITEFTTRSIAKVLRYSGFVESQADHDD